MDLLVGWTHSTGDHLCRKAPLSARDNTEKKTKCMSPVGFEPTMPVFERPDTSDAAGRSLATLIDGYTVAEWLGTCLCSLVLPHSAGKRVGGIARLSLRPIKGVPELRLGRLASGTLIELRLIVEACIYSCCVQSRTNQAVK